MSVPPDQMMAGGPPMDPMGGGPPMGPPGPPMGGGMAPNLLPFPSTQPAGVEQLLAPLLQQQQQDIDAVKQQQLEAVMAIVMQQMQQMPNPAAQEAQTLPAPPMDGQPGSPMDDQLMSGGGAGDPMSGGY